MSTNNTKQTTWVAIGSLCSYCITLVSSMILSRYFNKTDYGTYRQVLYVYHTLLTVFTLGLPRAFSYFLPRVPNDEAKNLIAKLTHLFLILGIVFSLGLFFFSPLIAKWMNNPDLTKALKLFAIVPTLLLPTLGLDGIMATFKKTLFLAIYKTTTSLLTLLCVALPVMVYDLGYMDAIKGFIVGSAIQCVFALYLRNYPIRKFGKEPCTVKVQEILKFSLPLLQASLWGLLISSTDQFFISRYFGNEVFAEFSNGSIELPFVPMIVGACATVLSPIFSRMSHEKMDFKTQVFPLWKSVFEKSAMLIYPLLIYCIVFASPIMEVLYGKQYSNSATYFNLKMLVNFFNLIAFAPLLINTGKVRFYSKVHAFTAIALIVLEYVGAVAFQSPYAVAIMSLICNIGKILVMLFAVAKMFNVGLIQLFPVRTLLKVIIPSFIVLYAMSYAFAKVLHFEGLLLLLVTLGLYTITYIMYCWAAKIDYVSIIRSLKN